MEFAEFQGLLRKRGLQSLNLSRRRREKGEENLAGATGIGTGLCRPECRPSRPATRPPCRLVPGLLPAGSGALPASRPAYAGPHVGLFGHLPGLPAGLCRPSCRLPRPSSRPPARLWPAPMPVRPHPYKPPLLPGSTPPEQFLPCSPPSSIVRP